VLVSFTLLIAVTSNLILLPSMLLSLERIIIGKDFEEPLMKIYDEPEERELEEEAEVPCRELLKEEDCEICRN
jgi:uncharacterized protein